MYHPFHVKQGGKLRLITDLRVLNCYCTPPKFSSENISNALDYIQADDFMISVDLKDGFWHVPVCEHDQQYLGIQWSGQYYVFRALPFGLNASPYFFQKVIRCVVQHLRAQDIRAMAYVDDFLIMGSQDQIAEHKKQLLGSLRQLGFLINWDKSQIDPDSKIVFLGHVLDSKGTNGVPEIRVMAEKVRKLRKDIRRAMKDGRVTARILACIAGQCVFATQAIIPGKLLLRNIYRQIATRYSWDDMLWLMPQSH